MGKFRKLVGSLVLFFCVLAIAFPAFAQQSNFKAPETVLTNEMIKAIIGEVSGKIPFDIEAALSWSGRVRTKAEFDGVFEEAAYIGNKLKEYGLDQVDVETLGREDSGRGGWWHGLDAELWMKSPEEKRLSRMSENYALMTRGCDEGEWEGELIYLDERDVPNFDKIDFKGKIILTPLYAGYFSRAYAKGAIGVISSNMPGKRAYDQFSVGYDMRMEKGGVKDKVFAFNIWGRLAEELKERLFNGEKIILRAKTKTANFPFKMDAVFAAIKGTQPDKPGLMFTAHMFERPQKIGANDNLSGCVTLVEIARTLNQLIKDGRIPRPERSIYFLMSEEGSGTMAYFKKYPEMAKKIMCNINMDMVGEDLDKNKSFFNIEVSPYSRMGFIETLAKNAAEYVFQTNIDKYCYHGQTPWIYFPVPIVDRTGSETPFRYTVSPFAGGSDHGVFLDADQNIPALSFNTWPDYWYHSDGDTPDKSDPTQIKRVAFIGACAALSASTGDPVILERLIRLSYEDRLAFIKGGVDRGLNEISALGKADGGAAFANAMIYLNQAVRLSRMSLLRVNELASDKPAVAKYLAGVSAGLDGVEKAYAGELKAHYQRICALKGIPAQYAATSADELKIRKIYTAKVKPLMVGDRMDYNGFSKAMQGDQQMMMDIFQKYSYEYFMQLYLASDGKRSLGDLREMLSFAYKPIDAATILKHAQALEKVGMLKLNGAAK